MAKPAAMGQQLALSLSLNPGYRFESFYGQGNGLAIRLLQAITQVDGEQQVYLFARPGCGKTHLLQATTQASAQQQLPAAYLPLSTPSLQPEVLQGLEHLQLVCIDDLQMVIGQAAWETALFDLINRLRAQRVPLVLSATKAPQRLGVVLPDLLSRLGWGPVLKLEPIAESEIHAALAERCQQLGLTATDAVINYLLSRVPREPSGLFALLDQLDRACLAAQRRLSIPMIRQHLEQSSAE